MQFSVNAMQNRGNSAQKEVTNQALWLANDQRNSQMANQMQALDSAKFEYTENLQTKRWLALWVCFLYEPPRQQYKSWKIALKTKTLWIALLFVCRCGKSGGGLEKRIAQWGNWKLRAGGAQHFARAILCRTKKQTRWGLYEPESLKVMIASLDRHVKNKGYSLSIVCDREFSSSKQVLDWKAKQLRLAGRGKDPNKARQLSKEEEDILWKSEKLGGKTPESLIHTMWWLPTQRFGLRGGQEPHGMRLENSGFMKRWRWPWICRVCWRANQNQTWRFKHKAKTVSAHNVPGWWWEMRSCAGTSAVGLQSQDESSILSLDKIQQRI